MRAKPHYRRGPRRGATPKPTTAAIKQRIGEVGMRLVDEDDLYPTIDLVLEADSDLKRGTVNKYSRELDPARTKWEAKHGEFPHRRRVAGGWKRRFVEQDNLILKNVGRIMSTEAQLARALEERDAALELAKEEKRLRLHLEKVIAIAGLDAGLSK